MGARVLGPVLVLAGAGALLVSSEQDASSPTSESALPQAAQAGERIETSSVLADAVPGLRILNSAYAERYVSYSEGSSSVELEYRDFDPVAGEWSTDTYEFGTSFTVERIESALGRWLIVQGRARSGDDLFELWEILPWEGGYEPTLASPLSGQGLPAVSTPVQLSVAVSGGVYLPQPIREGVPRVSRTEIFRGDEVAPVEDWAFDGNARRLWVLGGEPRQLWTVDLDTETPDITEVFAPGEYIAEESLTGLDSLAYLSGRMLTAHSEDDQASDPAIVVMIDSDQDGEIDAITEVPSSLWGSAFPDADFNNNLEWAWYWAE